MAGYHTCCYHRLPCLFQDHTLYSPLISAYFLKIPNLFADTPCVIFCVFLTIFQHIYYSIISKIRRSHERFNDGISAYTSHHFAEGGNLIWEKRDRQPP